MITAMGLERICQISIRTKDTARAVSFYRDTLGLKLLFQAPPQLAFFDCNGVRLMLSPAEPEFDHQGSVIYFAVEDIKATHAALVDRIAKDPRFPTLSRLWSTAMGVTPDFLEFGLQRVLDGLEAEIARHRTHPGRPRPRT